MAKIDRSSINSEQYAAPEFQSSGFDMSFSRHTSFALGRIHVGGIQYVMPGDKVYGSSKFDGTFNRIVTPMITPVRAMSYQVFLPFRAIDSSFMKGMTPTKLNAMSANWQAPTINTRDLVSDLLQALYDGIDQTIPDDPDDYTDNTTRLRIWLYLFGNLGQTNTLQDVIDDAISDGIFTQTDFDAFIFRPLYNLGALNPTSPLQQMADKLYLKDALEDIYNNYVYTLGLDDTGSIIDTSIPFNQFLYNLLNALFTPFLGRYSYYGELKYNYLRPWDLYRIANGIGVPTAAPYTLSGILNYFDGTPQNEYALRVMYAIWYEKFRNVDIEPVSATLPDWRDFGSTSIFDLSNGGNLLYLIWRIRSWEKDMFTTAQVDDISRHVFAPIFGNSDDLSSFNDQTYNLYDTQFDGDPSESSGGGQSRKFNTYSIGYYDQLNDTSRQISIPVPANVNDVLSDIDKSFADVYGLDLNTLRQSQMLERYLKRNYLFGDEYQDRLLAHYNSRLSDMRINRPEILGQSIGDYNMGQQISNVSTDKSNVGDRTATATIALSGDQYSTYIEEFGVIITLYTVMPRPMYDGICPQHLLSRQVDFPLPEFAANNEEFGRKMEIASSGLNSTLNGDGSDSRFMFGRYPAYHAWRSRVDEVGGMFLDELQDATFRRFWGMFSDNSTPKLNYMFLHCRPNLAMFANTNLYDTQVYGTIVNECYVERVLPTPVETI